MLFSLVPRFKLFDKFYDVYDHYLYEVNSVVGESKYTSTFTNTNINIGSYPISKNPVFYEYNNAVYFVSLWYGSYSDEWYKYNYWLCKLTSVNGSLTLTRLTKLVDDTNLDFYQLIHPDITTGKFIFIYGYQLSDTFPQREQLAIYIDDKNVTVKSPKTSSSIGFWYFFDTAELIAYDKNKLLVLASVDYDNRQNTNTYGRVYSLVYDTNGCIASSTLEDTIYSSATNELSYNYLTLLAISMNPDNTNLLLLTYHGRTNTKEPSLYKWIRNLLVY